MNKFLSIILFLNYTYVYSQTKEYNLKFMFYNVENLFDTQNDTLKDDDEFLPGNIRNWTYERYLDKLNKIYKVIAIAGEWSPPDIIGLCETENKTVIRDLINKTPLYKYNYEFVHYDSPDQRGIDVACLYNKDNLKVLKSKPVNVSNSNDLFFTRDILYICFELNKQDTLHVFINHWPSRRNGKEQSENKRMIASEVLKNQIDSLVSKKNKNIIVMGDFNDEPSDKSLLNISKNNMINISRFCNKTGSIKYKGNWFLFDQILLSQNLIDSTNFPYFNILHDDFLLNDDTDFSGKQPFRTYNGVKYNNGFSDHLPVFSNILLNNK